jgi:hypothetical protein
MIGRVIRAIATAPETRLIVIAILLRFASATTADVSFAALALLALRGRQQAIQALVLSWLFLMLNDAIAPEPPNGSIGRYAVLMAAALMLFVRRAPVRPSVRPVKVHTATFVLSGFLFYHSLLLSQMPDVSLLKALSWVLSLVVLMLCWQGLRPHERDRSEQFLFGLLVAILILSVPLLAVSAGRAVNGAGFQGILGHPQVYGISMAILGAWTALKVLSMPRAPLRLIAMAPVCCGFIVLSEARTALVAMLAGVLAAILSCGVLSGRRMREIMPGLRNRNVGALLLLGMIAVPIVVVAFEPLLLGFIDKRSGSGDFIEAYRASRGLLIDAMLQNIEKHFFTGIGFGIASAPEEMVIVRDPVLGLPISALVEKGALPFAVFEELGVFGFVVAVVWIGAVLAQCARAGVAPLGLALVFLLVNMGEATLFSPGGFGLIGLIFIAWGVTGGEAYGSRRRPMPVHARGLRVPPAA